MTIAEARNTLGVSRQKVVQRVKRGELNAVHVRAGRRKGLRIQVISPDERLFDTPAMTTAAV